MRDFMQELEGVNNRFNFDTRLVEQTSDEWHVMRFAVFTASNAKHLFSTKRGTKGVAYGTDYNIAPASTVGRKTYMEDLVAMVGAPQIPDDIKARPLQWGRDHEPAAREAYEALTYNIVGELPFIYKDSTMRAGASPDGIIQNVKK